MNVSKGYVRVYAQPEGITSLSFPRSEEDNGPYDDELENGAFPIGSDPSEYERQLDTHTRGNDSLLGYNDISKAGSPTVWSTDPAASLGKTVNDHGETGPGLEKTGSFWCPRCKENRPNSQNRSKIVKNPKNGLVQRVCEPTCKEML